MESVSNGVPKYLNTSTLSKNLFSIFILWLLLLYNIHNINMLPFEEMFMEIVISIRVSIFIEIVSVNLCEDFEETHKSFLEYSVFRRRFEPDNSRSKYYCLSQVFIKILLLLLQDQNCDFHEILLRWFVKIIDDIWTTVLYYLLWDFMRQGHHLCCRTCKYQEQHSTRWLHQKYFRLP